MKIELAIGIVAGIVILAALIITGRLIFRRIPRALKPVYFTAKWKELQRFCQDKATWPDALAAADKLLDEALKKRHFKGKSMGERLVAAQRQISNNDNVWYAHNLCKKVIDDAQLKLKEADVKQALLGIKQALKDLGAFAVKDDSPADNDNNVEAASK